MDITVIEEAGQVPVTVFQVRGPVTDNAELEQRAREVFERGARNILLDLSGVPYMATAGLRALHAIYSLLRVPAEENDAVVKAGIASGSYMSPHLKLLSPTAHVEEALNAAGYNMFIEIFRNRKQAIDAFHG
jgi:hypothetical protein